MFGVDRKSGSLLSYIRVKIRNREKYALYDSGASASLISPKIVKETGLSGDVVAGDSYRLKGAFPGGHTIPCGELQVPFFIGKILYVHNFIVAELSGDTDIILGEDFWCRHNSKSTNEYGCRTLWLNGHKVPLTTSRLTGKGDAIMAVPYSPKPKPQRCVNREVYLFRKQRVLPKTRLIVKVELPPDVRDDRIMLEALGDRQIDFVDQVTSVRKAQVLGKHHRAGCRDTNCTGCEEYQFAYLEIVNLTNKLLRLSKNRPIALASEFTKASKEELSKFVNQVQLGEPDYAKADRVQQISGMMKGKSPDYPEQEKFLKGLVAEFPQAFHLDGERLSVTDAMEHHISYEGPPLWHRQRPITQAKVPGLLKTVDKLILHGSIGASDSPYNFQTVPVYKHGTEAGTGDRPIRLTVDLSPLNRLTSRDRVTIPSWDEISAKLGGAKIFSKVDLKSAFHQISLDEASQRKTAFSIGPRTISVPYLSPRTRQ